MKPVIYTIEFPSGKSYIGSTVNFRDRRAHHLQQARRGKAVNQRLRAEFARHPVCGIYVVASGFARETLHELEAQVIAQRCPELNVNLTPTPLTTAEESKSRPFGPHPSIKHAAQMLGMPYQTLKRYARTMTFAEVEYKLQAPVKSAVERVGPPDPRRQSRLVNIGKGWEFRNELKLQYGVTDRAYSKRVAAGWSVKNALTIPLGAAPKPTPKVSRKSVCAKYGVATYLYTYRRAANWTVLQALNLAPHPPLKGRPPVKKRYLTAAGLTRSMDDWAKQSGFSKSNIYSRLTAGCTPEQAVGLEKTDRELRREANVAKASEKPKRPTYTLQGVTGNISELAEHFGVPYSQLSSRQRMGWPESDWLKVRDPRQKLERDKEARDSRQSTMRDEFAELLREYDTQ